MRGRALPVELLRPLLENVDVDDGHLVAIEVDDSDLLLGGVKVEGIFQLAEGGFTVTVERRSLARRLIEELER
jgi:hypothetical protein